MKKINPKLILTAIFGIFLSLIFILVINQKLTGQKSLNFNSPNASSIPENFLVKITLTKQNPALANLAIAPENPQTLSAFAIRLETPFLGQDLKKIIFRPNQELVNANWNFTINNVSLNEKGDMILVDIAAVNASSSGYGFNKGVELGTLNGISSLTFTLDKSQTKIVAKNANELSYIFVNQ